jgi:uncharacterized membrane protein YphA (DoxX/SURF4 family)
MKRLSHIIFSLWTYRIIRIFIAIIFIWAGASKLTDPKSFSRLISEYGIVPDQFLIPVAIGLPILEIVLGTALIFDIYGSLLGVTLLLIVFIAVLWFGILEGLNIDCGCFSLRETQQHDNLRSTLYRDIFFLLQTFFLFSWRVVNKTKLIAE